MSMDIENSMSKVYLFAAMLLFVPFTGCIELDDMVDDDTNDNSNTVEDAFYGYISAVETEDWGTFCKYIIYTVDGETDTIVLGNSTQLDKCIQEYEEQYIDTKFKFEITDYSDKELDYKAANNSGLVHTVTANIEICRMAEEDDEWDCEDEGEEETFWVQVDGKWLFWREQIEQGEPAPIVSIWAKSQDEDEEGIYYFEILTVSRQEKLEDFSFYLKDDTGSTYIGGNGFGEIAMQYMNGDEYGIDMSYGGDDEMLQDRAANVSNDDGSEFPVHFSDEDRDGKLSAGDMFIIYGQGNESNGPAEDGWRLDIQFDPTGDIVGSAKVTAEDETDEEDN